MSHKPRRIVFTTRLLLLALIIALRRLQQTRKTFDQSVCFA